MPQALLTKFHPISLQELDQRARLMRRTDKKYVLTRDELRHLLTAHRDDFDVLRIDEHLCFRYSNLYLDSPQLHTFVDHNKGRRRRFKVRFRHYHETQQYFFEIKIKGFRDETLKYRKLVDKASFHAATLAEPLYQFANQHIQKHYGAPLAFTLQPSIRVDYERITLVAKDGGERITIDNHIQYSSPQQEQYLAAEQFVVEVKSAVGRSAVDRWMRQQQKHPVKRCSKYCMGLNLLLFPDKNTRFRPVIRRHFRPHLPAAC